MNMHQGGEGVCKSIYPLHLLFRFSSLYRLDDQGKNYNCKLKVSIGYVEE